MNAWIIMVVAGKIKQPTSLHARIHSAGECVNAPWLMM